MSLQTVPLSPRDPDEPHRAATQLELFFDLVSVVAIAAVTESLHHAISDGHGLAAFANFVFLFLAIWWAWMNFTWFASAFDNDDALFRVLTIFIMGGALTFAGGADRIMETLDFGYGLLGWIIMRVGMIAMWLRAAAAGPEHRATALRYAGGIFVAQVLWSILYFGFAPGSPSFFAFGIFCFLVEWTVPVIAERAGVTPWHRHHIMERYGLLNIIVLGEILVSISLMVGHMYEGHIDTAFVREAVAALILVFVLWWIYFIDTDHLNSTDFGRVFLWGYGHVFVFGGGAVLAAGLGAYLDVLTHHGHVTAAIAAAWINAALAVYLGALWVIRDQFAGIGWRGHVLLAAALAYAVAAVFGVPPWGSALLAVITLLVRFRLGASPAP